MRIIIIQKKSKKIVAICNQESKMVYVGIRLDFSEFWAKKMLYPTDLVGYSIKGIFTFPHYHHLSKGSPKRPSQRLQQCRMNIKTFPFRQTFIFSQQLKKRGEQAPPKSQAINCSILTAQFPRDLSFRVFFWCSKNCSCNFLGCFAIQCLPQ